MDFLKLIDSDANEIIFLGSWFEFNNITNECFQSSVNNQHQVKITAKMTNSEDGSLEFLEKNTVLCERI